MIVVKSLYVTLFNQLRLVFIWKWCIIQNFKLADILAAVKWFSLVWYLNIQIICFTIGYFSTHFSHFFNSEWGIVFIVQKKSMVATVESRLLSFTFSNRKTMTWRSSGPYRTSQHVTYFRKILMAAYFYVSVQWNGLHNPVILPQPTILCKAMSTHWLIA